MTNQVNQAFEKWFESIIAEAYADNDKDFRQEFNRYKELYKYSWQAATKASESEINSLKERVAELESWKNQAIAVESEWDCQSVGKALNIPLGHSIRANILPKIKELTASNNQLREALEICKYDCHTGEVIGIAEKALKATPTQSLAEHDNETIERIALALENAEGEFKTLPEYVSLVRALKAST